MDKLPARERLADPEKAALIAALEAQAQAPRKEAHNSRLPPSQTLKPNRSPGPLVETRRAARVGRAGGGRPLPPEPAPVSIAQAKTGPHCGGPVQAHAHHLQAVDDQLELPPVTPIVTRVEQHAGQCPHGGRSSVAPVPVGMEPGTPVGASIQSLATSLRDTHASSDARLAALFTQVDGVSMSEGALAHLFQRVHTRLDDRGAEMLPRLRRSRLIGSDETGARGNGRPPWEWVFQHAEVCVPVMRPSRGHGVLRELLGDHRPTSWVSALYRAQRHPPAEAGQGGVAHQRRDCPFAIEAGETLFAPRMKAILRRAFAMHPRRDPLAASTR